MNQPTDFPTAMQGFIMGAFMRIGYTMLMEMLLIVVPMEKERLEQTLHHEMTNENWEDLLQLLGERAGNPRCLQRAEDREKIRRLVFGESS